MHDEAEEGLAPEGGEPEVWQRVSSERGPELFVGRVRFDTLRNPRTGRPMRRTVVEMPDWVNVIALTPAREVVVVRQYRFGREVVATEIPGGVVDPGETHEEAARRELREETGYTAPRWSYLGRVAPNPAFQDNLCHHWLAEDAERTHALELDPGEDLRVDRVALADVPRLVRAGVIDHSLVISALCRLVDLRG